MLDLFFKLGIRSTRILHGNSIFPQMQLSDFLRKASVPVSRGSREGAAPGVRGGRGGCHRSGSRAAAARARALTQARPPAGS